METTLPGVAAQKRPTPESLYLLIEALADTGDLALGDAIDAEGVREFFHFAGGDPVHVGLGDHGKERLLASPAGLKEAGEVAAFPQLGDGNGKSAHPGI